MLLLYLMIFQCVPLPNTIWTFASYRIIIRPFSHSVCNSKCKALNIQLKFNTENVQMRTHLLRLVCMKLNQESKLTRISINGKRGFHNILFCKRKQQSLSKVQPSEALSAFLHGHLDKIVIALTEILMMQKINGLEEHGLSTMVWKIDILDLCPPHLPLTHLLGTCLVSPKIALNAITLNHVIHETCLSVTFI